MTVSKDAVRATLSEAEVGGRSRVQGYIVPDVGRYVLMPGDPGRIDTMAAQWDEGSVNKYDLIRGYRCATGEYKGAHIAAYSTGIGAPSLENIYTTLASNGSDTFIRVGTTGAIQPDINMGDIIINDACVKMDGLTRQYVPDEYPAAATPIVTLALIEACENLGLPYHVGAGCTTASFYCGQGRPGFGAYRPSFQDNILKDMAAANVLNFEMEAAAVLTLGRIFGVRTGMCAVVVAQRITGEWNSTGVDHRACLVGAEAVRILTEWDRIAGEKGRKYFTPGLLLK